MSPFENLDGFIFSLQLNFEIFYLDCDDKIENENPQGVHWQQLKSC